jgi:hypothetical protein
VPAAKHRLKERLSGEHSRIRALNPLLVMYPFREAWSAPKGVSSDLRPFLDAKPFPMNLDRPGVVLAFTAALLIAKVPFRWDEWVGPPK